jgi:transposase
VWSGKRGRAAGKTIVVGMIERGGRLAAQVMPDVRKETLRDVVLENVEPGTIVSTDELMSCGLLAGDGYTHGAVKHTAKEGSWYEVHQQASRPCRHIGDSSRNRQGVEWIPLP